MIAGLIIGLVVGGIVGVTITCCCVVAGKDRQMEKENEHDH